MPQRGCGRTHGPATGRGGKVVDGSTARWEGSRDSRVLLHWIGLRMCKGENLRESTIIYHPKMTGFPLTSLGPPKRPAASLPDSRLVGEYRGELVILAGRGLFGGHQMPGNPAHLREFGAAVRERFGSFEVII